MRKKTIPSPSQCGVKSVFTLYMERLVETLSCILFLPYFIIEKRVQLYRT